MLQYKLYIENKIKNINFEIPKDTNLNFMNVYLKQVQDYQKMGYKIKNNYSLFEQEFKKQKNSLNITKSLLQSSITKTGNFLIRNQILIEQSDKSLIVNPELIELSKDSKLSLDNFLIQYIIDFSNEFAKSKSILTDTNEIDKTKILDFVKSNQTTDVKENTIKRISGHLIKFLTEIKSYDISYQEMITVLTEVATLDNEKENIDKIRFEILNKIDCSIEEKDVLKNRILTDGFINKFITKNYNKNIDDCVADLNGNYVNDTDYFEIIENGDKVVSKFNEYKQITHKDKTYPILILTDSDNDGTCGYAATNSVMNLLNLTDKVKTEYCIVGKDAIIKHGINLPHINSLVEKGVLSKTEKTLIMTIDNGINSQPEIDAISKKYPNFEFVITDHHLPNETLTQENDKVVIYNPQYKSDFKKLEGYNISGAHTWISILRQIMSQEKNKININLYRDTKKQIHNIAEMSNYMDLVHTKFKITNENVMNQLSKYSNLLNTIATLQPIWNHTPIKKEFLEQHFYINKDESEGLSKIMNELIIFADTMLTIFKQYKENPSIELDQRIFNIQTEKQDDLENEAYKLENNLLELRVMFIELLSKDKLTSQEQYLMNLLNNDKNGLLFRIKTMEKMTFDGFRQNKDKIYKEFRNEKTLIQIFNGINSRKYFKKAFNITNPSLEITLDNFDKNKDNKTTVSGSLRSTTFKLKDIFDISKIEQELNVKIEIAGHAEAAGIKIIDMSKKQRTKEDMLEIVKEIGNICNKNILLMEEQLENQIDMVYDVKLLPLYSQLMEKTKTKSNIKNYNPTLYIRASDLPIKEGVGNIVYGETDYIDDFGWKLATLDFDGNIVLCRNDDLKNIDKRHDFFELQYMGKNTFVIINKKKLFKQVEYITTINSINEKQIQFYKNEYNSSNNFTKEISWNDFLETNITLQQDKDKKITKDLIINTLKNINLDEMIVLDVEGTNFGKYPKLFNIGLIRFKLIQKNGKDDLIVYNTSLLIDPKESLSVAIERLTGITNGLLSKQNSNKVTLEQADSILVDEIKDKKCLIMAHNSLYDFNVVKANLPKFYEIWKSNLSMDTAQIAQELKLTQDFDEITETISISNTSIGIKDFELGKFNVSKLNQNNFTDFEQGKITKLIDNSGKKILTNENNEIYYQNMNEHNKPIYIGNINDIEQNNKPAALPTKYSVNALLKTIFIKQIKEELIKDKENGINIDNYNYNMTNIKKVLDIYEPNQDKTQNINRISKKINFDIQYIETVCNKIDILNDKLKQQYKKLLTIFSKDNFIELLHEQHNNLEYMLSDVGLEGTLNLNLLSKYMNYDQQQIEDYLLTVIVNTELKHTISNFKELPNINTFSFRQLVYQTQTVKTNKTNNQRLNDVLNKNVYTYEVGSNKILFEPNENVSNMTLDELEKFNTKVNKLLQIVYNSTVLENTFDNYKSQLDQINNKESPNNEESKKALKLNMKINNNLSSMYKIEQNKKDAIEQLKEFGDFLVINDYEDTLTKLLTNLCKPYLTYAIVKKNVTVVPQIKQLTEFDSKFSNVMLNSLDETKRKTNKKEKIEIPNHIFIQIHNTVINYIDKLSKQFNIDSKYVSDIKQIINTFINENYQTIDIEKKFKENGNETTLIKQKFLDSVSLIDKMLEQQWYTVWGLNEKMVDNKFKRKQNIGLNIKTIEME